MNKPCRVYGVDLNTFYFTHTRSFMMQSALLWQQTIQFIFGRYWSRFCQKFLRISLSSDHTLSLTSLRWQRPQPGRMPSHLQHPSGESGSCHLQSVNYLFVTTDSSHISFALGSQAFSLWSTHLQQYCILFPRTRGY
jgi:hypothetical protein